MISHPQVVHFPIALLIVALLFEIISYFWRKEEFSLFSLILLTLGTIGAFIALQTGEAAAEIIDKITGIGSIILDHEETAEQVFYIYLGIVIIKTFLIENHLLLIKIATRRDIRLKKIYFLGDYLC